MKPILIALALVAALALAACGGDDDEPSATVAMSDGVLVDSQGAALYTSEQEEDGQVRCTDACADIWLPLTASKPTAGSDVSGKLGVVKRPDGARQVTLDGTPLYRFADDGPGDVTGDGLSDSFAGQRFTWHVVGNAKSQPPSDNSY